MENVKQAQEVQPALVVRVDGSFEIVDARLSLFDVENIYRRMGQQIEGAKRNMFFQPPPEVVTASENGHEKD